jgi:hypothetical protein
MAAFNPAGATGIVVTRKKPGHFVVLTEDGRIDAYLAQNGLKLFDALEKRTAINVTNAFRGPNDMSEPLRPAASLKTIDPYDVTIAMPAEDGEPAVSDFQVDAWVKFRVVYDVVLTATPFIISGVMLLLPSQDPEALSERGTELFLPILGPTVDVSGVVLRDTPRDSILVNRSHIRRVKAAMRS